MIVRKSRRLVANIRQYETLEVMASIEVDTDHESVDLDDNLDRLIAADVFDADQYADSKSFIHKYAEDLDERIERKAKK